MPAIAKDPERPLIVVDPGHGGKDPGAINAAAGLREADLNLALAEAFVGASKKASYATLILRTSDVFLSLEDRARLANEAGAAALLSFHCNAAEDPADPLRESRSPGLAGFASRGVGVETDVADHDLALVGNMGRHPGDELKVAHPLELGTVVAVPVASPVDQRQLDELGQKLKG